MDSCLLLICICQEVFKSPHGGYLWQSISNQFLILQIYSNHNSYWIFFLYTSIHGVTALSFFGSSTRKFWLLIRFLISLIVSFSQGFFMSSDNFVTSEKFLVSGIKWETYEPDSTKGGKSCEISFTAVVNALCKTLPIFRVAFNAPFHSNFLCLIWSHIL